MFAVYCFSKKPVAVFGLGMSGIAAALALRAGGAEVFCWDDNPESIEKASAYGLNVCDLRKKNGKDFVALVLAPGVPLTHPQPHWSVEMAHSAGLEILGDIELFARERRLRAPEAPFIAVTGTNGKSTTTALIAHILCESGLEVEVGGNIGRAITSFKPLSSSCHYVIECSSFQIELAPSVDPDFGILLNITPDHLDRHGTLEHYALLKEHLVAQAHHSFIGVEDSFCSDIACRLYKKSKNVWPISSSLPVDTGYYAYGTELFEAKNRKSHKIASLEGLMALRGAHNRQNALAAVGVCIKIGLDCEAIQAALDSFSGLAHRMQIIAKKGRVLFFNDSKATNADASAAALSTFDRVYWILGGLPKAGGIESLRPFFPRVARAYIIGEAAPLFSSTFGRDVPFEISGDLVSAVKHASRDAAADTGNEAIVLFSPACASFDQFKNFEVRGEAFRTAVKNLGDIEPFLSCSVGGFHAKSS